MEEIRNQPNHFVNKTRTLCVCEIERVLNMTQSNASRHLNKLKTSGVITSEKKSQWVYYRIDNKFIEENNLLYECIKNKTVKNTQLQRDVERLNKINIKTVTLHVSNYGKIRFRCGNDWSKQLL